MDDTQRKAELRKDLQKNLQTKEILSKYYVKYPISAEQKYQKLLQRVMNAIKKGAFCVLKEIRALVTRREPEIGDFSERQRKSLRRRQRIQHLREDLEELEALFLTMEFWIASYGAEVNIPSEISQIVEYIQHLNWLEWDRAVQGTLHLEPPKGPYYDHLHNKTVEKWVKDNIRWLSEMPQDAVTEMKGIVYSAYIDGKSADEIVEEVEKRQLSFLKRNQALVINRVANINTEITKQKHLDAGVHTYIWWTRMDERVRKSHRRLHGRKFSWDNPPETDNGRHCHPGEDFGCRCIALPDFDLETIEL